MSSFTCLPITCQFANMWISAFWNLHKFTHGAVQDLAAMKQKRQKCINGCAKRKGNWFQNINAFMTIWRMEKWLLNLRLLVRFRTGENRCNSVNIVVPNYLSPEIELRDSEHWFGPSSFLGNHEKHLWRLGKRILMKRKVLCTRLCLVLLKGLGGFSISCTSCFSPAVLTPGCALALWKCFWLKQMMFLTYGCVRI